MYINFRKIRFHCYALGKIMGLDQEEKLSKRELKLLNKLEEKSILTEEEFEARDILRKQKRVSESSFSSTCIRYLTEEVFIYNKYGERIRPGGESVNESVTRILKGSLAETAAIELLSEYDGIKYKKNEHKFKNRWIVGKPDIIHRKRRGEKKVIDIKSSWDLYTFMDNLPKRVSLMNKCQVQGYNALTGADIGEVCHILVSAPEELIIKQINKLRFKNVFATEEEFEIAAELTRKSMIFDDIPFEKRVIRFKVEPNEDDQLAMFDRVDECREWLMQYQQNHENYFKKP